jgi:Tfp pilus assembly protein PilN
MSLSINLLPDLRQAKLREHRRRQLVTGVSVSIWVACGAVVALLSIYAAGQKVIIANTTKSIADEETSLKSVTGLIDALTADQHLAALPGLYGQRVYLSKFFTAYSQADPVTISISSMAVDGQGGLTITGGAPTFAEVAKLARAMEASNVSVGTGASSSNDPYFTNVNITSVENSSQAGVTFTISAILAPGVTSGSN